MKQMMNNLKNRWRNNKSTVILSVLLAMVSLAFGLYYMRVSRSPFASNARQQVKTMLSNMKMPKQTPIEGNLPSVENQIWYVNNKPTDTKEPLVTADNVVVLEAKDYTRIYNYSIGYSLDLPPKTTFDLSKNPKFVLAKNNRFRATISREWSVYEDIQYYIDYYFNRFLMDETYQKTNDITILSHTKEGKVETITAKMGGMAPDQFDMFTYVFVQTETRHFFRFYFNYKSDDAQMPKDIETAVSRFQYFAPIGNPVYDLDYFPVIPENWSQETKDLYNKIANSKTLEWGIFTKNIYAEGIEKTIPEMEKKLGFSFDVILSYMQLTWDFPTEFMQARADEGKLVELTYQVTTSNNEQLFGYSPLLGIYKGQHEEDIRRFARSAKAFGHPFLFRINNEMNSDWVSYGGVNNMSDPEIFVATWRRMYEIFDEEGVDNCIWIFNPNDRDAPPTGWNSSLAYYPGNEYVHMFGITGYNNGSYYAEVTAEYWREFETIMNEMVDIYQGNFDKFPWIMTEFSSSSIGGDKAKWIENMFKVLPNYPQLKIAVWFSYADFDFREDKKGVVSRPYWLDETPETLEAFRKGVISSRTQQ